MRKSLVFLLALILGISMLAVACGDDEGDGGAGDGGDAAAASSEVVVAIGGDPGDL